MIHDSIFLMVNSDVISDNIRVFRKFGNATIGVPCTSVMLTTEDSKVSEGQVPRDNLKITQTPQTYFLYELLEVY